MNSFINYSDKMTNLNIAVRLPENSYNSFIDLQSQKDSKRNRKKHTKKTWIFSASAPPPQPYIADKFAPPKI